ncbi:MAG: restriction endonuclease subunit S, partial [Paludibacteraceae bacterium]|nr:restriction endonuclease subunit S [Paludibacteraceae bacterium]
MKHDWEYKKLGEVAEIIGGSTPKTNVPEYWDGDYFWVTPAELKGDRFIKSTARTITDLAVNSTNLSLLPKGTVLLSSRAPIGKVAITEVPMYCNQGFKNIVCGNKLNNNYVYWLLYGKTEYLNSLGVGATFKEISKKIVENISIPVPPLPTQQAIVSELDTLSGIIAECKETLKDYDALEQSIFYDMFGDPVKNEKGWEVKKLGEIGFCCSGGTPSRSNPEYFNGDIMWYSAGELNEMYLGDSVEKITETALNNCSAKICKAGSLFVG